MAAVPISGSHMATSAESGGICLVSSAAECCAHATGHRQPQAAVAAIIQLRHTAAASRWRHVSKSGLQRLCCQGCHNSDSQQISMQFAQLIQGCATCIVMQPSRLKMRVILQSYLGRIVRGATGCQPLLYMEPCWRGCADESCQQVDLVSTLCATTMGMFIARVESTATGGVRGCLMSKHCLSILRRARQKKRRAADSILYGAVLQFS